MVQLPDSEKNTLKKSSEFDNFTKKCIYSIAIYKACLENLNHKEQFFAYCFLSGIKGLGVAERGNVMVIKGQNKKLPSKNIISPGVI